jgi:PPOX class probable F420-dependent enzyme
MAIVLPEEAKALVRSEKLAHLATVNPDGSPQVTLAWVGLDGEEIVIGTLFDQRKLRNIRRDPRVTLSIQGAGRNAIGLDEYLVVDGAARVTEGGAPGLLQELARTYLGPNVRFPPMPDPPAGFVTRIAVERIGGVGPWAPGRG